MLNSNTKRFVAARYNRFRCPAGRLDTLHVVLSGQPNATSKPKGLHTGDFGLPLIVVKGGLSYM